MSKPLNGNAYRLQTIEDLGARRHAACRRITLTTYYYYYYHYCVGNGA